MICSRYRSWSRSPGRYRYCGALSHLSSYLAFFLVRLNFWGGRRCRKPTLSNRFLFESDGWNAHIDLRLHFLTTDLTGLIRDPVALLCILSYFLGGVPLPPCPIGQESCAKFLLCFHFRLVVAATNMIVFKILPKKKKLIWCHFFSLF